MPIGNLAVLDTSVYIENFRTGRFTLSLLRSPWIVCCSAVVLHELRRGARTALEIRFVTELAKKVRTVTPTERHWVESAEILSRLRTRKGYDPKKSKGSGVRRAYCLGSERYRGHAGHLQSERLR